MLYSALLIAAFFIPAYNHVSAFSFIGLAIGAVSTDSEVTFIDIMVVLLPLLFIPISACIILWRAFKHRPFNGLLLSLPLFFLLFFFLILSFDMNRQVNNVNAITLIKEMSIGFYLAALASVLLLFSYSKREALNLGSKR
jgi:fatty-acid desaturase